MDKPFHTISADIPGAETEKSVNGTSGTNGINGVHGTDGVNGEKPTPHNEEKPSLIDTAKSAAADLANGLKGLAVSK